MSHLTCRVERRAVRTCVLLTAALGLALAWPAPGDATHGPQACYAQAALRGASVRFSAPAFTHGTPRLRLRGGSGQPPVMLTQSPACAPAVRTGHTYAASLDYRSTRGALTFEVLTHGPHGWRAWYAAAKAGRRARFGTLRVLLAPIQGGIDRIAFGLLAQGAGEVQSRGFALIDASAHPQALAPALPAATPQAGVLAPGVPHEETTPPPNEEETPARTGRWRVLEDSAQARSVHAILLQNGKLLVMAGSGNDPMAFKAGTFRSYLYDPAANTWKELITPKDVFCSGHVQLADGNVLILGGTSAYPPEPKPGEYPSTAYKGENTSWIFNIHTDKYENVPYDEANPHNPTEPGPLLGGEWYPSATELGSGDVISFGGLDEQGQGDTKTNYFVDPANSADNGDLPGQWVGFGSGKLQQTYPWYWGEYPSMILTADGRLFYDGSHVFGNGLESTQQAPTGSSLYDFYCGEPPLGGGPGENPNEPNPDALVKGPNGTFARVTPTPGLRSPDMRDQSASLLLPPAQSQKVMIMGGGNTYTTLAGSAQSALDTTDEIDLREASPRWRPGPDLPQGRMEDGSMEPAGAGKMYISAVALPDGTVLETGGSEHVRADDVHEASIFDPQRDTFASVAADPVGRDYHSEALLLPDGRVIALGSNPVDAVSGIARFETRVSIFEPPYLFKGPRPAIDAIDGLANATAADGTTQTTQWEYGSEHVVGYSASAPIASAVLVRPGAVTHSSDPNQREVALPIVADANGALTVKLTENDNIAPPGYYMAFLLDAHGVPSVAQWVHVGPQGAPAP